MITVGKHPSTLVHGDGYPASFYIGDKMVAGYEEKTVTGDGVAGTETQYNGNIPSAVIQGIGRQETLTGKNLLKPMSKRIKDDYTGSSTPPGTPRPFDGNRYYVGLTYNDYYAPPNVISYKYIESTDTYEVQNKNSIYGIALDVKVKPSTTYTIEFENIIGNYDNNPVWGIGLYDKDKKIIRFVGNSKTFSHVVQTNANCEWMTVCLSGSVKNKITYVKPMVLEGSVSEYSYEPYCGGIPAPNPDYPIEPEFLDGAKVVSAGRNLAIQEKILPFSRYNFTVDYDQAEKKLHAYGTPTDIYLVSGFIPFIKPKGKSIATFSFSGNFPDELVNVMVYGYIREGGKYFTIGGAGKRYDFIATLSLENQDGLIADDLYFHFSGLQKEKPYDFYFDASIRFDEKAPNYEPYFDGGMVNVPILRQIPGTDIRDEYDVQTGKLTRRVGSVKLTPNLSWYYFDIPGRLYQHYFGWKGIIHKRDAITTTSNIAKGWMINEREDDFNTCYTFNDGLSLNISPETGLTSTESWKAYLAEHQNDPNPPTIWYALAEPIIEQYDPAKLKQHPGYTQLIQQGGFAPAPVKGTFNVKKE